ncbi:hypothetical protein [Acinetobacter sp. ANC 4640]
MNIYKFSYDSQQDALNSLANYYQVSVEEINSRIHKIKAIINKLHSYVDRDIGFALWEIRDLLNQEQRELDNPIFQISFYHRCVTNGQQSWFEDGLLNSLDGIASFMQKVIVLVSEDMGIKIESLQSIILTKSLDEEKSETDGINGFYRLKDAKSSTGFDIPEVFSDYSSGEKYSELKTKILTVLEPTIVKFYVEREINELDRILKNYWELVLDDKLVTQSGDNAGRGKIIPPSQIEKIIYLNRE